MKAEQGESMLFESDRRFREMIDALPAAIYMTDAEGRLTYFNSAAVKFSGRVPELGTDRWCISFKLYRPDGTVLPHDQCPMAIALKENRPVLGEEAIAERPDGTRLWFEPYPVPLRNAEGGVVGGINMLVDITERKTSEVKLAQLASIVDCSDDAIVSKTLDGIIVSWNRAAQTMFGYTADEAIGKHICLIIPPDRRAEEQDVLLRLRRGERIDHFETERQAKDGRRLFISLTVSPIRNGKGEIIGASKVARDITERVKAQELLRQRTAQFETLLNQAPIGVFVVDTNFRISEVNPVARPVFGNIGNLLGCDIAEVMRILWPKEFADEIVGILRNTLETGESHSLPERSEYRLDRGVFEVHEWQFNRIPLPNGEQGVVCYFREISSQVKVREELREADRRKDEFLATLAHELRNPLAPIRNSLQILRLAGSENGAVSDVREMIERQLNHMVRLVDDLMEVSRITRGKIELRKERVELAAVIRSAVEFSKSLIEPAGHRLSVSLPDEPLVLEVDPIRLVQVLTNLLNNSAKYTPPEGQIWISAWREGGSAVVSVRDNGIGIPADMLPKVFDLFAQVNRQTNRAQGGLGIGLTLVRSLVNLHGGSVEARSAGTDQGSEFLIWLPLAGSREMTSIPGVQVPPIEKMAALRILVVDDNRDAANSLGMLLGMLGAEVHSVHDGMAALGALDTYRPSIVLLDIGMPQMDGYEVARRARQNPHGRDVTLIALTGWGQEQDRNKSREAGFDHHLVKPVALSELQGLLARLSQKNASPAAVTA